MEFFLTGMGRKFYESDVPRIAQALERIADRLGERVLARPSEHDAEGTDDNDPCNGRECHTCEIECPHGGVSHDMSCGPEGDGAPPTEKPTCQQCGRRIPLVDLEAYRAGNNPDAVPLYCEACFRDRFDKVRTQRLDDYMSGLEDALNAAKAVEYTSSMRPEVARDIAVAKIEFLLHTTRARHL